MKNGRSNPLMLFLEIVFDSTGSYQNIWFFSFSDVPFGAREFFLLLAKVTVIKMDFTLDQIPQPRVDGTSPRPFA